MAVLQDQKWKWVRQKKGGDALEEEERVGKFSTRLSVLQGAVTKAEGCYPRPRTGASPAICAEPR